MQQKETRALVLKARNRLLKEYLLHTQEIGALLALAQTEQTMRRIEQQLAQRQSVIQKVGNACRFLKQKGEKEGGAEARELKQLMEAVFVLEQQTMEQMKEALGALKAQCSKARLETKAVAAYSAFLPQGAGAYED